MRAERLDELAPLLLRPFAVPAITPAALALFRVLLGLGLLYILLWYEPIQARTVDVWNPHGPFGRIGWVHALIGNRGATFALQVLACSAAVLFTLGIAARTAFIVVVSLLLVDVLMLLSRTGGHDWGVPIVTLLALTVVPWGDTPNVFELHGSWAKYSDARLASRAYGFAVWLPGLTVGLAFAAAAYAKLEISGLRWITNGTVRYHFVEDGRLAPVSLGLWIAVHPALAVVMSLAGVLIEAAFIFIVFARSWKVRTAFGLAGASLLAGFALFQGVDWWPWRILFLAFLPWSLLISDNAGAVGSDSSSQRDAPVRSSRRRDLTWLHASMVVVLIGTQVWASQQKVEIEPFISNFPMYSYTWSSPEEFERGHIRERYEADGADITDRVDAAGGGFLKQLVEQPGDGESKRLDLERAQRDMSAFRLRYEELFGHVPSQIEVYLVRRPFDWQQGRYLPGSEERAGTVHVGY